VSQEDKDKADVAEARTQQTKGFMQQVRVIARRNYILIKPYVRGYEMNPLGFAMLNKVSIQE